MPCINLLCCCIDDIIVLTYYYSSSMVAQREIGVFPSGYSKGAGLGTRAEGVLHALSMRKTQSQEGVCHTTFLLQL